VADDRDLGEAQAALVTALSAGGPPPGRIDAGRLEALSVVLRGKRRKGVATTCPGIRRALGVTFAGRFDEYARATPLAERAESIDDARGFLRWLQDRGQRPRELRWLGLELRLRRVVRTLVGWAGAGP
jgi:hypothetical protein